MNQGHVLLCTLGPVQDFISTARRCQDLWFGSWLLSDLSLVAAKAIEKHATQSGIVFPAGLASKGPGAANRILAVLPEGVDPKDAAEAGEKAVMQRLETLRKGVFEGLKGDPNVDLEMARLQIEEMMEWFWIASPLTNTTDYPTARSQAESWLAARKTSRDWSQPNWTPPGGLPKSSLDGNRESVLHKRIFHKDYPENKRRERYGVKGAEQLCGIGLLKRLGPTADPQLLGNNRPHFHSTSHIAVGPVLARITSLNMENRASDYIRTLEDLGLNTKPFRTGGPHAAALRGLDGSLLLESRLPDHFEENSSLPKEGPARSDAVMAATNALHQLLWDLDLPGEPMPYYAFLIADGDRMGSSIDSIKTPEGHHQLSESLNAFSEDCKTIVEEHEGSLIFAGGDDVVALLPLHTALECSAALAAAFEKEVGQTAARLGASKPLPTLSVGLGISHCREDMSDARKLAKRAEKLAKVERDSLAILLSKRSGSELEIAGTWSSELIDRLTTWAAHLNAGALSRKASHDLEAVTDHFEGLPAAEINERTDEIIAYTTAICRAKRVSGGGDKVGDEVLNALLDALRIPTTSPYNPLQQLRSLIHEIQIADLFARAKNQAAPSQGDPS